MIDSGCIELMNTIKSGKQLQRFNSDHIKKSIIWKNILMRLWLKIPFINKHGFVEYPFLHDERKESNWWFFNLLEDYLKRRARQKHGHTWIHAGSYG